jgi:hypothetical protein
MIIRNNELSNLLNDFIKICNLCLKYFYKLYNFYNCILYKCII